MEIWKSLPDYEGIYEVSNLGNVRSLDRIVIDSIGRKRKYIGALKTKSKDKKGYYVCRLNNQKNTKTFHIHQLVAMAFLEHKCNGNTIVVDHIDNDIENNRLSNLQLLTNRENVTKTNKTKSSKYRGVSYQKDRGKWVSCIIINKKTVFLGRFENEKEASNAYEEKLKEIIVF